MYLKKEPYAGYTLLLGKLTGDISFLSDNVLFNLLIFRKLSDALNMNVVVDKIATHTDSGGQQDPSR